MNRFYYRQGNNIVEYLVAFILVGLVVGYAILNISPESYRNYFSKSFRNAGPLNNGKIVIKPIDGSDLIANNPTTPSSSSGGPTEPEVHPANPNNPTESSPPANGCYPTFEGEVCTPLDNGCKVSVVCYLNGKKVYEGDYNEQKDCLPSDEGCVVADLAWYYNGEKIFDGGFDNKEVCSPLDLECLLGTITWELPGKKSSP